MLTYDELKAGMRSVFVAPAHTDGLDAVITLFTEIRDKSLEETDNTPGHTLISFPASEIDPLLLMLQAAQRYRNFLHKWQRWNFIMTGAAFGLAFGAWAILLARLFRFPQ